MSDDTIANDGTIAAANPAAFPHHTPGANMPRWAIDGVAMFADRVHELVGNVLHLESGTKVTASPELLASGPARTGDFYTFHEGAETLMPGAEFAAKALRIPHSVDVAAVSPDVQPGFRAGEPASGDPKDPLVNEKPIVDAPASVGDPPVEKKE